MLREELLIGFGVADGIKGADPHDVPSPALARAYGAAECWMAESGQASSELLGAGFGSKGRDLDVVGPASAGHDHGVHAFRANEFQPGGLRIDAGWVGTEPHDMPPTRPGAAVGEGLGLVPLVSQLSSEPVGLLLEGQRRHLDPEVAVGMVPIVRASDITGVIGAIVNTVIGTVVNAVIDTVVHAVINAVIDTVVNAVIDAIVDVGMLIDDVFSDRSRRLSELVRVVVRGILRALRELLEGLGWRGAGLGRF